MKKISIFISSLVLAFSFNSCDNFLDIEPEGKVIPKTQEEFRALLTQGYVAYPGHKSLSALRTDETVLQSDNFDFMSFRDIFAWKDQGQDKQTTEFPWLAFYTSVFYANHTIVDGAEVLTASVEKDQLLAEAYALRAYAFFDLVNLYGKPYNPATANTELSIPLALEIDLENVLQPESIETVYNQIHKDLDKAKSLAQVNVQEPGYNYRFSKAAIYALEARVNLYEHKWQDAINSSSQALAYKSELEDLNNSQLVPSHFQSKESILALEATLSSSMKSSITVSDELINAYDKDNDLRFAKFYEKNGSNYKVIKVGNLENKTSIRTAELYFIKAEAHAQLNQMTEAVASIQPVIDTRYTPEVAATLKNSISKLNKEDFITFLLEERFKEFSFEGHRWFDLRRINQKKIIHTTNGTEYILQQNDPRYTLPYPTNARLNNPNL